MDDLRVVSPRSVICLGETAFHVLARSRQGRVLAVLSKAVYLLDEPGRLVWLTTNETPMHRRAVRIGGLLPRPRAGSTYTTSDRELRFDDGSVFDWRRAHIWREPGRAGALRLARDDLSTYLRSVRGFVDALPAPRGFGVLIATNPQADISADACAVSSLKLALPTIQEMVGAWRAGDRRRALMTAENLVGLGEGLTPSGDDFVGGMLLAAANLGSASGPDLGFSPSAIRRFLAQARHRTNLISYTLLGDHAAGHASQTLHRLLQALQRGDPVEVISRFAAGVIQIGHSTGWDLLAGLWTALNLGCPGASEPSGLRLSRPNLA